MLSLLLVNHIDYGSLRTELIGDASANTVGTTSYYNYFIFEHISKGTLFSVTNANSQYKLQNNWREYTIKIVFLSMDM
jgi:hypothetical protein